VEAEGADNSTPRLALALLYKRAYSSAYSVAETAGRRMRAMDTDAPARSLQMLLPLASDDDFEMADEAPLLTAPLLQDERRERALLACLVDAASAAMPMESKLAVLQRLLRRLAAMREHAIVFTEYRDTLLHVARRLRQAHGVVHGGMTAAERRSVIGSFVRGTTNLLLATDAASEGLNLQASCRVVINLELPWSPVRLEQRIGRVDRLGQERRVHVFHLIGRDTNESDVASRLIERVRRSAEDVGATDPLGTSAAEWIEPATPRFRMVDEARTELARLRAIRASGFADDPSAHTQDVLIATCGRRALRLATGRRPVALFREAVEDETGRAVAIRVTGVIAAAGEAGRPRDRASRLLAAAEGARYGGANADDAWPRESVAAYGQFWTTRRSREENSAASAATEERPAQAGLFDRQLEHERQAHLEKREEQQRATRDRMAGITRAATTRLVRARPALVLLP
jgi:superfamily II DNA/RNA helicase